VVCEAICSVEHTQVAMSCESESEIKTLLDLALKNQWELACSRIVLRAALGSLN
jgi:hypothetical protein